LTSVISKKTCLALGKTKLLSADNVTLLSTGGKLTTLGLFHTTLKLKVEATVKIYVVDSNIENLLGGDSATILQLVKHVDMVNLGMIKCQPVKIKLKEGTIPYSVTTARRVPIPLKEKVKRELQRMKDDGVIKEITEPTEWVSPMVPVVKPDGDVRICVDLKKLNKAVERERFIIPTIDDIIHQLQGSSIFSKLDAQSGFWQIPLDMSTAKLTTFITPFGRFYFTRVPFGISSAPEIFQRIMTDILQGITGVICYFDDILCHSKTA
jgi:hypothetical protein